MKLSRLQLLCPRVQTTAKVSHLLRLIVADLTLRALIDTTNNESHIGSSGQGEAGEKEEDTFRAHIATSIFGILWLKSFKTKHFYTQAGLMCYLIHELLSTLRLQKVLVNSFQTNHNF